MIYLTFILLISLFSSCSCTSCKDSLKINFINEHGSFRIDSIYIDTGQHASVMKNGNKRIKYSSGFMIISPSIGDSIFKSKGIMEYVLIKKDSTYIQTWDCEQSKAIILNRWKTL